MHVLSIYGRRPSQKRRLVDVPGDVGNTRMSIPIFEIIKYGVLSSTYLYYRSFYLSTLLLDSSPDLPFTWPPLSLNGLYVLTQALRLRKPY